MMLFGQMPWEWNNLSPRWQRRLVLFYDAYITAMYGKPKDDTATMGEEPDE